MNAMLNTKVDGIDSFYNDVGALSESPVETGFLLKCKLSVLTGSQQGAEALLAAGDTWSIGHDLSNDIVLRDISCLNHKVSITARDAAITVRCLSGIVIVDGMSLNAGNETTQSNLVLVQMGNVALSLKIESSGELSQSGVSPIEPQCTASSSEGERQQTQGDSWTELADLQIPKDASEGTTEPLCENSNSKNRTSWLCALALLLGAAVVWQSGLFAESVPKVVSLSDSLKASPFSELKVHQSGQVASISGFISSYAESMQLNLWLDQFGVQIENNIVVGDVISERVLDVFRVHGISADVSVTAVDGAVNSVVVTQEADLHLLEVVKKRVLSDVPGIRNIDVRNTPPEVIEPEKNSPVVPGKRVAMVIFDAPAYVVTEDQSRYFVGSLLPTGHRIDSIADGKVMLSKDDSRTVLKF